MAFDLCPCLDALFAGMPAEAVLPRLARWGFRRFEFWDWRTRDLARLARQSQSLGLSVAAFSGNTFAEPLLDRAAHGTALAHLRRSLAVAHDLGASLLVVHVGYARRGRSRVAQWGAAVAGLRAAGDLAAAAGVTLAVEPLNSRRDHPGYFLDTLPEAVRLLRAVAHPAVRLLLDVYHMRVMHADLLDRLPGVLPETVHLHVADVPGRGEPGSGTIPWPAVLRILRAGGYHGAIGLECWPTRSAADGLRRSADALGDSAEQPPVRPAASAEGR